MENIRQIKVFLASPSGLDHVRKAMRDTFDKFNKNTANIRGYHFTPFGWEDTTAGNDRPQTLINMDINECDALILIFKDRWGSSPDSDGIFSSGCEEEWSLSEKLISCDEATMQDRACIFISVPPNQLADPGPQLSKVLKFKVELEQSKTDYYVTVESDHDCIDILESLLNSWLYNLESTGLIRRQSPSVSNTYTPKLPDFDNPTNARVIEAQELLSDGRYTEAEVLLAKEVITGKSEEAANQYGLLLKFLGRYDMARVMYEQTIELARMANSKYWEGAALCNLGSLFLEIGESAKARELFLNCIEIDEELEYKEGLAKIYANLGIAEMHLGDYEQCEEYVNKSISLFKELGDEKGVSDNHLTLGLAHSIFGNIKEAKRHVTLSLEKFKEDIDIVGAARRYGAMGHIMRSEGETDLAIQYFQKCNDIANEFQLLDLYANSLCDLSDLYLTVPEKEDEGLDLLEEAYNIYVSIGNKKGVALTSAKIGQLYYFSDQFEESLSYLSESVKLYYELENIPELILACSMLARTYIKLGLKDEALKLLDSSVSLAKEINLPYQLAISFYTLGEYYRDIETESALENYKKALEHFANFSDNNSQDTIIEINRIIETLTSY